MAEEKVIFRSTFPEDIQKALDTIEQHRVRYLANNEVEPDAETEYAAEVLAESVCSYPSKFLKWYGIEEEDAAEHYVNMASGCRTMESHYKNSKLPDGTGVGTTTWKRTGFKETEYDYKYERSTRRNVFITEFPKDVKAALDQAILYQKAMYTAHKNSSHVVYPWPIPEWVVLLASLFRYQMWGVERPASPSDILSRLRHSRAEHGEGVDQMFWWMEHYGMVSLLKETHTRIDETYEDRSTYHITKWERI